MWCLKEPIIDVYVFVCIIGKLQMHAMDFEPTTSLSTLFLQEEASFEFEFIGNPIIDIY